MSDTAKTAGLKASLRGQLIEPKDPYEKARALCNGMNRQATRGNCPSY